MNELKNQALILQELYFNSLGRLDNKWLWDSLVTGRQALLRRWNQYEIRAGNFRGAKFKMTAPIRTWIRAANNVRATSDLWPRGISANLFRTRSTSNRRHTQHSSVLCCWQNRWRTPTRILMDWRCKMISISEKNVRWTTCHWHWFPSVHIIRAAAFRAGCKRDKRRRTRSNHGLLYGNCATCMLMSCEALKSCQDESITMTSIHKICRRVESLLIYEKAAELPRARTCSHR